jgi:hypothetical protein
VAAGSVAGGIAGLGYYLLVSGKLTIDTGVDRRIRPLGPFGVQIAAPVATVFDVIAAPYLGRTPRAMAARLRVLERGKDMVLAEHYTPLYRGRLTAVTLETVLFDRPGRVSFRLVRGPVPHVAEEFALTEHNGVTTLAYSGDLGTDFAIAGQWWASRVAPALGRGGPRLIRQHPGRSRTPRPPRHPQSLTTSFAAQGMRLVRRDLAAPAVPFAAHRRAPRPPRPPDQ